MFFFSVCISYVEKLKTSAFKRLLLFDFENFLLWICWGGK